MNIRVICVGKIREKFIKQGMDEYIKRLSRYAKIEIFEVEDEKAPESLSLAKALQVKEREGAKLLRLIREASIKIVLDVKGQTFTSEAFANKISHLAISGQSSLDFVIGGSLGLDEKIIKQADLLLSFSSFTFPHQLMRLILLEQIYRVFKINKGEPYHK